jgi:hypothetical protein
MMALLGGRIAKFSRSTLQNEEAARIRGEYGISRLQTRMFAAAEHISGIGWD